SALGTLVLPVDPAHWPPPTTPIELDAAPFVPKHELHVTLVGRALGAEVLDAIAAGRIDGRELREAFVAQRWRMRRSGWHLRLRRPAPDDAIESVIELVALPAMARFHAWLGSALGRSLPVPPPHVTVHVRGDPDGIGVADAAALAQLRVGPAWRA
ncbi:MAG: hypothetical protein ACREO3_11175, partial [Arenimonas sp.]